VILVDLNGVCLARPGRPLFEDLSLTVSSGQRIGIVGLNGGGKSSLVGVISGTVEPDSGTVRRGRGVRISSLDQDPRLSEGTVQTVVGDSWELEAVLDRLDLADRLDQPTSALSGGEAKRVALARCLVAESDLLLLDEPTNHLDLETVAWLGERLATYQGGLILVTHDRHLVDAVTNQVLELDRGQAYLHDGGYATYLLNRSQRESQAARSESVRRNLVRRELAWLRRGAKARTSKSKARIDAANELMAAEPGSGPRESDIDWDLGTPRLGDKVVELHGVGYRFPDGPELFSGLELLIGPRERLGIVGPNGAGKTTLLELMARLREPTSGSVVHGTTVELAYFDQTGAELDPDLRVREIVVGPDRDPTWRDTKLMEAFWFDDDAQFAQVRYLSGGERRRLQLLVALAQQPNVLLLDEPTNDLDLDTLRSLEDYLDVWPGALVVVSHDRAFLSRTVDDVIVLDGAGGAGRFPGGYEAWVEERLSRRARGKVGSRSTRGATAGSGRSASEVGRSAGGGDNTAGGGDNTAGGGDNTGDTTTRTSASTLRHRLKALEKEIAKLEKRRGELTGALEAAGTDHEALASAGAALGEVTAAIGEAEEEWLAVSGDLEDRR
jgi:ATP-binding cassette subfamily F protein uup